MKSKRKDAQRFIVFWGTEADHVYGGEVYIGSALADGSIARMKQRAERTAGRKLQLIAYGSVKSQAQFREFLSDVKHAKIKGNWYHTECSITRTMDLLNGYVVRAA